VVTFPGAFLQLRILSIIEEQKRREDYWIGRTKSGKKHELKPYRSKKCSETIQNQCI
jgi:hypothetical protein